METAAVPRGTSHVKAKQRCNGATALADFQNALCKATVTHLESHTTKAQCVCTEAENSAIVAFVKRLGLISRSGAQSGHRNKK